MDLENTKRIVYNDILRELAIHDGDDVKIIMSRPLFILLVNEIVVLRDGYICTLFGHKLDIIESSEYSWCFGVNEYIYV